MRLFRKLRKPRFVLAYLLVPVLFLIAHTTMGRWWVGLGVGLLGLAVRFWANGYVGHVKVNWTQKWRGDAKIGQLVTAGPYAYLRHPLYVGNALIGGGVLIIVGRFWVAMLALSLLVVAYRRKIRKEEAILLDEWPQAYARYQQAIPCYLPTWRAYPHPQGRWSWQGIRASKEWKAQIWVIVMAIALYLRSEVFEEHDFLGPQEKTLHVVLLLVAAVLIACDGVFELRRLSRS